MLQRLPLLLLLTALICSMLAPVPAGAAPSADAGLSSNPAFSKVWERTDQLVSAHNVARTWFWGEAPFARTLEPFAGGPGGQRLVEYYDKSRMEVTYPGANPLTSWYVSNGLLVKELMSGRIQTGPNPDQVLVRDPAVAPVVGDIVPGQPA